MPTTRPIAQTTQQIYAYVDHDEALESGDERYVPLDEARGTGNITRLLTDLIKEMDSNVVEGAPRKHARLLVAGHAGCGKTTELYRLRKLLIEENFAVVYFDATKDYENRDVEWWNVLLEMVLQIDEQLSQPPYNLQVPDDLLNVATEWLASVITKKTERADMEASLSTELSVGTGLSFFAKAKAAINAFIKTGSSYVKEVKQEAERRPSVLREAVGDIVAYVQNHLSPHRGLVIIADGLEKMTLRPLNGGLTTHNVLFVHNSAHLKAPPCHLVYTLPLALLNDKNIGQFFPDPVLMPMVHVRRRDGQEDRRALKLMEQVVKARIAPDLFAPGVINMLALASGGHIRDFLRLVREAALGAGARIAKADAERAIARLVDLYNRTIKQEFIAPLDHVAALGELPGGAHDGNLVDLLLVLEYRDKVTWTALHPCV